MSTSPGKFIVLDGVEGCGKSTQARLLAAWLEAHGTPALLTHEPGAAPVGGALRHLLLQSEAQMTPLTETFLFCADRAEHVSTVIVPALLDGRWVICDRFSAATFAYQVWAGGVEPAAFLSLDETARAALKSVPGPQTSRGLPDRTLLLDLDPAAGLARKSADAADKIEQRPAAYHLRVRAGFLRYAEQCGGPVTLLNAAASPEEIFAQILLILGLEA